MAYHHGRGQLPDDRASTCSLPWLRTHRRLGRSANRRSGVQLAQVPKVAHFLTAVHQGLWCKCGRLYDATRYQGPSSRPRDSYFQADGIFGERFCQVRQQQRNVIWINNLISFKQYLVCLVFYNTDCK